ncbi:MAG TPA: hypothetical protein VLJ62_18685 [Burkholderiaceae bacterium]|jgi:uncharacterized membrane protein|nr:hypothetical protein [Burkholderiaceae bacterium]HYJ99520.1 hypothetical protein [Burkholderiaceae bacterium]
MPSWRALAVALALAGYALLSHVLMVVAADRPWAVLVLLGPLLLGVSALALQQRHLPSLLACMVAACGLWAYVSAHEGLHRIEHLYVLQHAGIHFALGFVFATTLRHGGTPLISAFALRVHRTVTPELLRYTRQVTWAWSLYFAAMVALSLALFVAAPWWWWSVFANLVTPVAAISLFVGEYLLRYRLHPEFERITLAQALQAYRDTPLIEARRP